MKEEYKILHRQMIHDIVRCMQLELPEKERAESCFWIAKNYWEKLKEIVKSNDFKDESEEIIFFREVKPQFTLHIEYFVLLSEALQFVPDNDACALEFWNEENKRLKRFCDKNVAFIKYYESGEHGADAMLFLREINRRSFTVVTAPLFDMDMDFCTSHDHVLRGYLAHKKYNEYVNSRIAALKEKANTEQ